MPLRTPTQEPPLRGALAAYSRGLDRRLRGALAPIERTVLPSPPSSLQVLVMLTRSRELSISRGLLDPGHLYDLRTFKACWAELAYFYRLAGDGKRYGGTVVTSMRELVKGLAPLHPRWKLSGDDWEDRDRHHGSVRRRLSALAGAGLLEWSHRLDEDLEQRATVLRLLEVPDLSAAELEAAAARLELWAGRYDRDLNSGSPIEIHDVLRVARPLTASERQGRGCRQARRKARARGSLAGSGGESQTISHPPSRAPSENSTALASTANAHEIRDVCGQASRITSAGKGALATAAVTAPETTAARKRGPKPGVGFAVVQGLELVERVRARREALAPVLALKVAQATSRAEEVAVWPRERPLPWGRLYEAWVVWRYGVGTAAEWGSQFAGRLGPADRRRLHRAWARYERHADRRPDGWPERGLGALAQIAAGAAEPGQEGLAASAWRPGKLRSAIVALDQLTRRMRAKGARDPDRLTKLAGRAAKRRKPPAPSRFEYRIDPKRVWPAWVILDSAGMPVLVDGDLVVQDSGRVHVPARHDPHYVETLRDARLLAGLWPQASGDGALRMAVRDRPDGVELRVRAEPGPYPPCERDGLPMPPSRSAAVGASDQMARGRDVHLDIAELAALTGLNVMALARLAPEAIHTMLERARAFREAGQRRADD